MRLNDITKGDEGMARRKRGRSGRTAQGGTLTALRRRAAAMMAQLRRAGMRQVQQLERQIAKLDRERQGLLAHLELGRAGTRDGRRRPVRSTRRGRRSGVDWNAVFSKLPKTRFRAADVKILAPGVGAGTISQRLTRWVKEKKLRRTGTRRGTRYTRVA